MALSYPQTDGYALDFSRLEFDANGKVYDRIMNVSTSQPIEEGVLFGSKSGPITRTRGQKQMGDGSFEMEWEAAVSFLKDLGDGWQEKLFTISQTWKRPGSEPIKVILKGCRLLDCEIDQEPGPDPLNAVFPFSFIDRVINDKKALLD